MAAFLSFVQRKQNEGPSFGKQYDSAIAAGEHQQQIDPWNLGVTTSTSTVESTTQHSTSEETLVSTRAPPTPEGLRPRKSIQRIRRDVLECNHFRHEMNFRQKLSTANGPYPPPVEGTQSLYRDTSALPLRPPASTFPSSFESYGGEVGATVLPPSIHRAGRPSIHSSSSFYDQSVEGNTNFDEDMDSSMEYSYAQKSRRIPRPHQIAVSPDLYRGGKAKTAVGALLVAMAETTKKPESNTASKANEYNSEMYNGTSRHSILPPRTWMDNHHTEDHCSGTHYVDEDDTIRDDLEEDDDDNQSSLHLSPSSLRRNHRGRSWMNHQAHYAQDTSFTRKILNDDLSSSRFEEKSIKVKRSPYNFNSIMADDITGDSKQDTFDAPRILSLVQDDEGLNLSAISHSHHHKDTESMNTSLADTLEEEEYEDYKEIPMYYQALTDGVQEANFISDDDLRLKKARNQLQQKEDVLRSTFERLRDSLDLLKEVYSQRSLDNSLFLGLDKMKTVAQYYRHLETLYSELQESDTSERQRQALRFCLSILQNTTAFSNASADQHSCFSTSLPSPPTATRWLPLPGFRSSLGLEEEPQSPATVRGGDTSLFSLPSDSANDSTPHMSNVSLTTTLTTVVSPGKYCTHRHKFGMRKTIEALAHGLHRLEASCLRLKSGMTQGEKSSIVESIANIYSDLLNIPLVDLELVLSSFEMDFIKQRRLTRTVSDDEENIFSQLVPRSHAFYDKSFLQEDVGVPVENLRVNIVQCDEDDIDDDNRNQSIECDLWSPTSNDMQSLVSARSMEESRPTANALANGPYAALVDDEEHFDDLRRTIGSFEEESVQDEREAPPSGDDEGEGRDHLESFPATFGRRVVAQRSRKVRFWKKRFMALKNRGRQVTAE